MKDGSLKTFLEDLVPLKVPKIEEPIEKTCDNCADYLVCWGFDEPEVPDKAKTCPSWHLDFDVFQELLEEQENPNEA